MGGQGVLVIQVADLADRLDVGQLKPWPLIRAEGIVRGYAIVLQGRPNVSAGAVLGPDEIARLHTAMHTEFR